MLAIGTNAAPEDHPSPYVAPLRAQEVEVRKKAARGDEPRGIVSEVPPLRLSTFNGSPGRYPTGLDGRADWTDEFYAHMDRVERRTPHNRDLRFGYDELARAMEQLRAKYPKWYTLITAIDVHGVPIEEYVIETGAAIDVVRRQRKKATFFLYQMLRLNLHFARVKVDFLTFREV